jgi:Ni/Co efflux regulator RcnB
MRMKSIYAFGLAAGVFAAPLTSLADPHKDESGHGKHRQERHAQKQEYWDGNCKVERKWDKNGEYKEERKCKGGGQGGHGPAVVYGPQPVYVPGPVVIEQPGVVIQGTVRVP